MSVTYASTASSIATSSLSLSSDERSAESRRPRRRQAANGRYHKPRSGFEAKDVHASRTKRGASGLGCRQRNLREEPPSRRPRRRPHRRTVTDLPADATVLDIGCGDGKRTLANLVAGSGETGVIGLDFSRRSLELARETVPGVLLVQADMTAIPVGEGAIDAITAYHAVFHVPRVDHPIVYGEFERVLRPGGVLLMTVGTSRHEGTRHDWLGSDHPMFWSTPGKTETYSQLRDASFEIVEERTVDDPLGSEALFVFAEARS